MKLSFSKKIMSMVLVPIVFICIFVAFVSTKTLKNSLTNEIKDKLKVGAYSIDQSLSENTSKNSIDLILEQIKLNTDVDSTIFDNNIRVFSTIDNAIGTKMDSEIYLRLQSGDDYFSDNANVNGESYFGYYLPKFNDSQEYIGCIFTGISRVNADNVIRNSMINIVVCIAICGTIIIVTSFVLVKIMVNSINKLNKTIDTLTNNDLSITYDKLPKEHDELGMLYNRTVVFNDQLKDIISKIKNISSDMTDIASDLNDDSNYAEGYSIEISKAVEDVAKGAVSQAEDTGDVTNKVSDMSQELTTIKDNANHLHNIAQSMNETKDNVIITLSELQDINSTVVEKMDSTSNQVNITNSSMQKIKSVIEMIKDIVEHTKLLSLNASIEAARAGEHGRGFGVVAEEIGKLANDSSSSLISIETILNDLEINYDIIIDNVKNTTDNMKTQNDKIQDTQNVFKLLEDNINVSVTKILDINSMVESLDEEIKIIVDLVSNLSAISEENSASAEQTTASLQELNSSISKIHDKSKQISKEADELMLNMNIFNIG